VEETGLPVEWDGRENTGLQIGFIEHTDPDDEERVGSTMVFI
jgi:hypothetical protein